MFRRPVMLSASFARTVTREGRYGDGRGGHGLSLLVKRGASGKLSKSWSQRLTLNGTNTRRGLGSYPKITLASARKLALANAQAVAEGRNPWEKMPTFAELAERTIVMNAASWRGNRTEAIWRSALNTYATPLFGEHHIGDISTGDVLRCLEPIWLERPHIAGKLRVMLSSVFKVAIANGHRRDDPAQAVLALLPKRNVPSEHHPAVPHQRIGIALATVQKSKAELAAKLCLEWVVHTACRSGEARNARWKDIDPGGRNWVVPAAQSKVAREHRVPLSNECMELLARASALKGKSGLLFPSVRGKVMTDSRLSAVLRDNAVDGTVHGFRSSFRDWCGETGKPRELAELCLGHSVGNAVERAYARSDLLERRRQLMEEWSAHVSAQLRKLIPGCELKSEADMPETVFPQLA